MATRVCVLVKCIEVGLEYELLWTRIAQGEVCNTQDERWFGGITFGKSDSYSLYLSQDDTVPFCIANWSIERVRVSLVLNFWWWKKRNWRDICGTLRVQSLLSMSNRKVIHSYSRLRFLSLNLIRSNPCIKPWQFSRSPNCFSRKKRYVIRHLIAMLWLKIR